MKLGDAIHYESRDEIVYALQGAYKRGKNLTERKNAMELILSEGL